MDPELAALAAEAAAGTAPGAAAARLAAVRALLQLGRAQAAVDRYHAAIVLGAAESLADVAAGHELALQAMAQHRPARELAARLYDRLRRLQGRPQKFGTERAPDGAPWPVDPATTDSERAKWDLPPRQLP